MKPTWSFVFVVLCVLTPVMAAGDMLSLMSSLPVCASECVTSALPSVDCALTDTACFCTDAFLWSNVTACAEATCTTRDSLTTLKLAKEACGVPVRDNSAVLTIVIPILLAISTFFVTLRIIARSPRRFELFGWDDGLIILSLLVGVPLVVGDLYQVHNGMGKDIWEVSFHQITQMLFWFYNAEPFYLVSTILFKLSMLAFYLRVFVDSRFRTMVYIMMAVCGATAVAFSFAVIFQCTPISYAWTRWDNQEHGKCIDMHAGTWTHAICNIVLDLVVLALPLPQLIKLQLTYTWRDKVQIVIMFGVGLLVTLISGLRLRSLVLFANTVNPTYDDLAVALWSGIEVFTGIICACLPTARVFIMRILPKWLHLSRTGPSSEQPPTMSQIATGTWKQPSTRSLQMRSAESTADFFELKDVPDGKHDHYYGIAL